MKRWVVRPGDGERLEEILRRAGEDARAVAEGRVFIGKKRAIRADEKVRPGDEVKIGAPTRADAPQDRAPKGFTVQRDPDVVILFERDGLVACIKPPGIPTVPDHAGAAHTLVHVVARKIGRDPSVMRVTSRLDREVSGVVVFATDDEAEARLRTAREQGRYARRYVAIATNAKALAPVGEGVRLATTQPAWDAPIGRAKDVRLRAIAGPDAKPARTRWAIAGLSGDADFALLAVAPETGRTHQIRLHASHAGAPLLGDRDYGGPSRLTLASGRVVSLPRIALHAARVGVPDSRGELVFADAPIPDELRKMWAELGGAAEAWDTAVSCELDA